MKWARHPSFQLLIGLILLYLLVRRDMLVNRQKGEAIQKAQAEIQATQMDASEVLKRVDGFRVGAYAAHEKTQQMIREMAEQLAVPLTRPTTQP